ncbi:MAG: acetate--CoA ligase family protein [Acidobacteriota bacterium]|nr:acetate--CoA ligase family protein [Acidobacteriota bacterium]
MLRPRSVAVVGASSTPGSLGASVVQNLDAAQYAGAVYLVNPKRPVLHGRQCLGSVEELPCGVDCAVLAIPASAVVEAARTCGRMGVGSLIVFSAGFAEAGTAGRAAQQELAAVAREYGMVVEGPNCLGMVNYRDGVALTFVSNKHCAQREGAGAAILSQSGALAAVLAVNMQHHQIPLTYSVSTGNEAVNGVEDFVDYFVADSSTRVLALVVEQFRKPQQFLAAAVRAQQAGKHVVLLHPGSSQAARASAVTHTGAMSGDYAMMQALVRHAGVLQVETMEELVDVTQLLVCLREMPRAGAAIFTESGAFKALTLDLCERVGLPLPQLSAAAESALREALPAFIPPSNPLDLTAQGLVDPTLYRRTLPSVLEDACFGSVVLAIILTDAQTMELKLPPILDALRTLRPAKPVVFAALDEGAPLEARFLTALRELGVACFPSPERALRALARVTQWQPGRAVVPPAADPALAGRTLPSGVWTEVASKALLAAAGIRIAAGSLVHTVEQALAAADALGWPVVLKAQSTELPHKTEAGGVMLGIDGEEALRQSWATLQDNVQRYRPGLVLEGVLVESMQAQGTELILGARRDADWGIVLVAGFGGVQAELLHDLRLLPSGLTAQAMEQELHQLKQSALLHGFRGSPALDTAAVAEMLVALDVLMTSAPQIREIDLNPVVVYARGRGALALDGLVITD